MSTMLEIQGLTKQFGQFTAVDDISFSVESGEVLGFLGPNGSGKSTTMKMVTGFLSPTAGTAIVCGKDVTRDPIAVKRHIGYLPEGAPLYEDMTPSGMLSFVADVRGLSGAERRNGIDNAVDKLLGHALMQGMLPLDKYVMLVSGRVSFEIVQKALAAGIPIVAAVSAPSSLAVELAEDANMTLIGFLRSGCMNVYTGEARIAPAEKA